MPIFVMLFLIPLAAAAAVEYILCRYPKKRFWRYLPPIVSLTGVVIVTLARYHGWDEAGAVAPLETLLFFPGLPALGLFVGLFLGWRAWKYLWHPRVFHERKQKKP